MCWMMLVFCDRFCVVVGLVCMLLVIIMIMCNWCLLMLM